MSMKQESGIDQDVFLVRFDMTDVSLFGVRQFYNLRSDLREVSETSLQDAISTGHGDRAQEQERVVNCGSMITGRRQIKAFPGTQGGIPYSLIDAQPRILMEIFNTQNFEPQAHVVCVLPYTNVASPPH